MIRRVTELDRATGELDSLTFCLWGDCIHETEENASKFSLCLQIRQD